MTTVVLTSRQDQIDHKLVKGPKFYCQSEFQTGKIEEIEKAPIVSRSSANGTSSLFKATTTNKNIFALLQYFTPILLVSSGRKRLLSRE